MLCILEFKITAVPTYPETKLASDLWIDNQNDTYLLDGDTNQIDGVTLMNGYYEIDYGTTGTFIRPNGSVDPPTSFITTSDNITYTFTGNITDSIVVEKNNIVVNGARYTLYGNNSGVGITIGGRSNVTIKSVQIRAFTVGIELRYYSTAISMIENDIENCETGIQLEASDYNAILGNNVTNNGMGVFIQESSYNNVSGNWIQANDYQGVQIAGWSGSASHNTISSNRIQYNSLDGIALNYSAHANSILENEIVGNGRYGVEIILGENNSIFHNNFIDNTAGQAYVYDCPNFWNNDYPYGGNYWNTYFNKTDLFRGVTQNENGSDGIADDPYIVDANNTDYYPLMGPFGSSTMAGANVTVFPTDGVDLTFDTVTVAGSTTAIEFAAGPSPPSDWFSVGSFYDVTTTASYSGNTTVRIVYDDSNLTLTQEMSLRLERWDATTAALYDVNGDWKEDAKDVYRVGKAYGTTLEGPNPPGRKYDPPCDFNHDGKIDMKDYYMVQKYYGQPTGTWVTITTYVDTANNVIYGETSHFSGIGIHYFR
jgi:parallel beta-helix repeat protein